MAMVAVDREGRIVSTVVLVRRVRVCGKEKVGGEKGALRRRMWCFVVGGGGSMVSMRDLQCVLNSEQSVGGRLCLGPGLRSMRCEACSNLSGGVGSNQS